MGSASPARQVGLDDRASNFSAALPAPERAARVRGYDLSLDQHKVVRQVRGRTQILVLGRLFYRYSLLLRPAFGLRLQLLAHGGQRYALVTGGVASPK